MFGAFHGVKMAALGVCCGVVMAAAAPIFSQVGRRGPKTGLNVEIMFI